MRKVSLLMITMFLLVALSSNAFAWSPQLQGQPEDFRPGDSRGVFIWHDGEGMHLRTTTYGQEHVFFGVIRTDGRFDAVRGYREEAGDFHRVSWDRDNITFRFNTEGGVDGLNFRVHDGEHVTFDLYMDGHRISTKQIYIGHEGWHPHHSEFQISR